MYISLLPLGDLYELFWKSPDTLTEEVRVPVAHNKHPPERVCWVLEDKRKPPWPRGSFHTSLEPTSGQGAAGRCFHTQKMVLRVLLAGGTPEAKARQREPTRATSLSCMIHMTASLLTDQGDAAGQRFQGLSEL